MTRILTAIIVFSFVLSNSTSDLRAAECEDTIARHMVGEALLAAQFVAFAEKAGMTPSEINAIFKMPDVIEKMHAAGFELVGGTPEDFGNLLARENAQWAPTVKKLGLKID